MHDRPITLRIPSPGDGTAIHDLVDRSKPLDLNSIYCYLLLCDHFRNTCIVATENSSVVGFVSAYFHPEKPGTLFIWQVAVDPSMRNRSLATSMLEGLLDRNHSGGPVRFLETTVNPSNKASFGLFRAFAEKRGAALGEIPCYGRELFGRESSHEEEILLRIGPFPGT